MSLKFTNIQHDFRKQNKLTLNEYVLCDMIFFLSNKDSGKVPNWCYMTKQKMAEEMGVSKQSIMNLLKKLIQKGFLIKQDVTNFVKTSSKWQKVYFTDGKESLPEEERKFTDVGKESLLFDGKESLPNNNIYYNNKNTNKDKETRKLKFSLKHFREVFIDLGCDQEMLEDWIEVKKKKKSPFTRTAAKGIINECNKYNLPVSEAIKICAENGWAGFKYSWYQNLQQQNRTENNLNISEVINSEAAKGFSLKDIK